MFSKHRYIIPLAALLATSASAYAGGDFVVIRHTTANLVDATPRLLSTFNLPPNVNTINLLANYAVLDLVVRQSEFDFNEVYINPPTTVCTANSTDANQPASIGMLDEHDDINLKGENATNHFTVNPSLLRPGNNVLMICIRSVTGAAGPGIGNLDNVAIRSAVLHYHTIP